MVCFWGFWSVHIQHLLKSFSWPTSRQRLGSVVKNSSISYYLKIVTQSKCQSFKIKVCDKHYSYLGNLWNSNHLWCDVWNIINSSYVIYCFEGFAYIFSRVKSTFFKRNILRLPTILHVYIFITTESWIIVSSFTVEQHVVVPNLMKCWNN